MARKYAWLTVLGATLSAGLAIGQQPMQNPANAGPYGNPGLYGYSGYPTSPYGAAPPMAPNTPFGPPMPYGYPVPGSPYGQPMMQNGNFVPHLPYTNSAVAPMPGQNGAGPNFNVGEPYLVPNERSSPAKNATETPQPHTETMPIPGAELPATDGVGQTFQRFMQFLSPDEPSEPYTMYEGRRYPAEMRQDNTRMWVNASYLHWWIRRDSAPPLVSTGDPTQPLPAAFGGPNSAVLLGNGPIGPKEFSGVQANLGFWLDPEKLESLEFGGFWLGRTGRQYNIGSDGAGNPLLATPLQLPDESGFFFAAPGASVGTVRVSSVMNLHGLEANLGRNLVRLNNWTLDALLGVRYLYLNDTLTADYNVTSLVPGLPFVGAPQPAGTNLLISDSFNVTNRFYGGQLGARVNWVCCRFDVTAVAKIAFGANAQVAVIDGTTTLGGAGSTNTAVGGVLAQPSNIGRHTDTVFAVVPEGSLTAGFHVTPCIRVFAGYTFLYWNRIQRAVNQIDRQVDLAQPPTSPAFAPGAAAFSPHYNASRTDFWAQGVNVGVELKY